MFLNHVFIHFLTISQQEAPPAAGYAQVTQLSTHERTQTHSAPCNNFSGTGAVTPGELWILIQLLLGNLHLIIQQPAAKPIIDPVR